MLSKPFLIEEGYNTFTNIFIGCRYTNVKKNVKVFLHIKLIKSYIKINICGIKRIQFDVSFNTHFLYLFRNLVSMIC